MGKKSKTKWAICPKCGRNCPVARTESLETEDWQPIGTTKRINDSEFRVQCGGCGVFFKADINKSVPCWEEIVEEYDI